MSLQRGSCRGCTCTRMATPPTSLRASNTSGRCEGGQLAAAAAAATGGGGSQLAALEPPSRCLQTALNARNANPTPTGLLGPLCSRF
jgi:hypothetical protein